MYMEKLPMDTEYASPVWFQPSGMPKLYELLTLEDHNLTIIKKLVPASMGKETSKVIPQEAFLLEQIFECFLYAFVFHLETFLCPLRLLWHLTLFSLSSDTDTSDRESQIGERPQNFK